MKKELVYSIILAISTFLLGISFGYYLVSLEIEKLFIKYEKIKTLVDSAMYYLQDYNSYCDLNDLYILGKKVDELGYQIALIENSDNPFKDENKLQLLKSQYFNLEYLHYLLAKKQMKNCNSPLYIILFFYLPDKDCKDCKAQGYQLTHLKKLNPNKILIYSFDLSYPNYFIYYYKEKFKITKVPFMILITKNSTITFRGFTSWEKLSEYIK